MFIYSDTAPKSGAMTPYHKQNADRGYLTHYANYLYLSFILNQSDSLAEKHQAQKELTICERKLNWWAKHANFNSDYVIAEVGKMKREWEMPKLQTPGI